MPTIAPIGPPNTENIAPNGRYGARVKIESPSATALAKRSSAVNIQSPNKPDEASGSANIDHISEESKSSPAKSLKASPIKVSPSRVGLMF